MPARRVLGHTVLDALLLSHAGVRARRDGTLRAAGAPWAAVGAVMGALLCSSCELPSDVPADGEGTWTELASFGANPGNLAMYLYEPPGVPSSAPLVVALHGCTQTAAEYADLSGWNGLADRHGFYVVYGEQRIANNLTRCFNWFDPADAARGQGEAQSIMAAVETMRAEHAVDPQRIFVTGFSAGGFMAAALLAAYRDELGGAAIIAAGPAGCATSLFESSQCASPGVSHTAAEWGELARSACPSCTGHPLVSLFQGSADTVVSSSNLGELVKQWTNVADIDQTADLVDTVHGHGHEVHLESGNPVVEAWTLSGMGHAVPVDPGSGCEQGGAAGAYGEDVDVWSSYRAARFWGLADDCGS